MFAKKTYGVLAFTLLAGAAFAQPASVKPQMLPQPDKNVTYASAADVAALIARAQKEKKGNSPLVVSKILQYGKSGVYLEYRENVKPLADVGLHPTDDEIVYIVQGSGTLVTGGTMAADHMSIAGGESRKFAKGDFFFIPAGTPHWISKVDSTIAQVSIHIPKPAAAN